MHCIFLAQKKSKSMISKILKSWKKSKHDACPMPVIEVADSSQIRAMINLIHYLTATDQLQCGVDSSHRLHYVGFQEMREVE